MFSMLHSDTNSTEKVWDEEQLDVDRSPVMAVGGSVIAAILSSACCWIPLLALAFSAHIHSIAKFFEQQRWIFIGASCVLLAVGFYMVYFKKVCCAANPGGGKCGRLRTINVVSLWIGVVAVGAGAILPEYFADELYAVIEKSAEVQVDDREHNGALATVNIDIAGMTCPGCAATIKQALGDIPGVVVAKVSFDDEAAVLKLEDEVSTTGILSAIEELGFRGIIRLDQNQTETLSINKPIDESS